MPSFQLGIRARGDGCSHDMCCDPGSLGRSVFELRVCVSIRLRSECVLSSGCCSHAVWSLPVLSGPC